MIELKEKTLVDTIWFTGSVEADWLGIVMKQPDAPWYALYRFRYHKDDKFWDSDDERSWYKFENHSSETGPEKLVAAIGALAQMCAVRYGGKLHTYDVKGSGMDAMDVFQNAPWSSVRQVEEDEVQGGDGDESGGGQKG